MISYFDENPLILLSFLVAVSVKISCIYLPFKDSSFILLCFRYGIAYTVTQWVKDFTSMVCSVFHNRNFQKLCQWVFVHLELLNELNILSVYGIKIG